MRGGVRRLSGPRLTGQSVQRLHLQRRRWCRNLCHAVPNVRQQRPHEEGDREQPADSANSKIVRMSCHVSVLGDVGWRIETGRRFNFASRKTRIIGYGTKLRMGMPLQLAPPTHPDVRFAANAVRKGSLRQLPPIAAAGYSPASRRLGERQE